MYAVLVNQCNSWFWIETDALPYPYYTDLDKAQHYIRNMSIKVKGEHKELGGYVISYYNDSLSKLKKSNKLPPKFWRCDPFTLLEYEDEAKKAGVANYQLWVDLYIDEFDRNYHRLCDTEKRKVHIPSLIAKKKFIMQPCLYEKELASAFFLDSADDLILLDYFIFLSRANEIANRLFVCSNCGKMFVQKRVNSFTCSSECSKRYYDAQMKSNGYAKVVHTFAARFSRSKTALSEMGVETKEFVDLYKQWRDYALSLLKIDSFYDRKFYSCPLYSVDEFKDRLEQKWSELEIKNVYKRLAK